MQLQGDRRGARRTSSGVALMFVSPVLSVISTGASTRVESSKLCSRVASTKCNIWSPKFIPGHNLLPAPNGINSKCWPLASTSLWVVRNLSGLNSVGFDQTFGSRWSFHRFSINLVPLGTWKPPTVQSSVNSRWPGSGPAGYKRNVMRANVHIEAATGLNLEAYHEEQRQERHTKHVDLVMAPPLGVVQNPEGETLVNQ
ncbi:hypothetical protein RJ639_026335, partial [Escallonia herrerae]